MSTPIGDALGSIEHFAERIIDHGKADVRRVWDDITSHRDPHAYHQDGGAADAAEPTTNGDTAMSAATDAFEGVIAGIKTAVEQHVAPLEAAAAQLTRFTSEPLVARVLAALEAGSPVARSVIEAGVTAAEAVTAATAAAPADPQPASDAPAQQPQMSGIAQ